MGIFRLADNPQVQPAQPASPEWRDIAFGEEVRFRPKYVKELTQVVWDWRQKTAQAQSQAKTGQEVYKAFSASNVSCT